MINRKFLVFALALAAFGATPGDAHARREKGGNGGGAFVCLDAGDSVLWAQSQEIWTIRDRDGRLAELAGDFSEIADQAIARLGTVNLRLRELVEKEKRSILGKMKFRNAWIAYPGDSRHVWENRRCADGRPEFKTAAIYLDDSDEVFFVEPIWAKLSEIDRAALLVHEAVYKVMRRNYGDDDSDRTQAIVRSVFREGVDEKDAARIPEFCLRTAAGRCSVAVGIELETREGARPLNIYFLFLKTKPNGKVVLRTTREELRPSEVIPLGEISSGRRYVSLTWSSGRQVVDFYRLKIRIAGEIVVDETGSAFLSGLWLEGNRKSEGVLPFADWEKYIP